MGALRSTIFVVSCFHAICAAIVLHKFRYHKYIQLDIHCLRILEEQGQNISLNEFCRFRLQFCVFPSEMFLLSHLASCRIPTVQVTIESRCARKVLGEGCWICCWDHLLIYPLVMTHIAIENGPSIVFFFPIKDGDFP